MKLFSAKYAQTDDVVQFGDHKSLYKVTGRSEDGTSVNLTIMCRHDPNDPETATVPVYQGILVLNNADLSRHHTMHPAMQV